MGEGSCLVPFNMGAVSGDASPEIRTCTKAQSHPRWLSPPPGVARHLAAAATISCAAAASLAQDSVQIGEPSPYRTGDMTTVTLAPTTEAGAVAELTYINRDVNGPKDSGSYHVAIPGLTVEVAFWWTSDADSVELILPPGFYADPPFLDLSEGAQASTLIFSGEWSGL